mgnify:CR=1 FL=1
MNTLMFFYTLAILVICIVTAVLSLVRLCLVSFVRFFIYGSGVFICYAIEMTEIFFFEYTLQNQSFPASDYYSITMPVLRTLVATASQAFIWLIAMDLLDKHSKKTVVIPVATFFLERAAGRLFAVPYRPHCINGSTTRCVRYSLFSWGYISFGRHARAHKSS